MIPPILAQRSAAGFWLAVLLTGAGTGLAAAALTGLLELVQHLVWGGGGQDLLQAASHAAPWWHLAALLGAGLLTGAGQLLLTRLSSANGIDITAAIWFHAGRLPPLRTLGSAVLSVVIVGMGAALGREGAPKQAGAVIANAMSDRVRLSDEERRLLVACGAGAGMAAAYGVPLGGALFALEVLRGALALRFVLPALVTALVATGVSWAFLPDAPLYVIPDLSRLDLQHRLGAAGRADRGAGFGALRPGGGVGRWPQAQGFAPAMGAGRGAWRAGGRVDPVAAIAWQRA